MKRISAFVALVVLLCGVAQARHSQRYQVHYNPYAFGYHNSGLVSGGVRYSMHAFGYHNSGLIQEYQTGGGTLPCRPLIVCSAPQSRVNAETRFSSTPRPTASSCRCSVLTQTRRETENNDGLNVIRKYLAEQGHKDICIKHHLSVENQTVGAVIVLAESNLVLAYTDTEALAALAGETGYKKHAIERLEQSLAEASQIMLAKGGQVYAIDTAERNQILVALQKCTPLNPNTTSPRPVYAKN